MECGTDPSFTLFISKYNQTFKMRKWKSDGNRVAPFTKLSFLTNRLKYYFLFLLQGTQTAWLFILNFFFHITLFCEHQVLIRTKTTNVHRSIDNISRCAYTQSYSHSRVSQTSDAKTLAQEFSGARRTLVAAPPTSIFMTGCRLLYVATNGGSQVWGLGQRVSRSSLCAFGSGVKCDSAFTSPHCI